MTIKKVFYRAPHNFDYEANSDECTVKDFGPSLTVQADVDDVDLNVIMRRFGVTGKMPETARPIFYGDFDNITDYRTAQEAVIRGREAFGAMPAEVRARFGNDPQQFLEFCETPNNRDELVRLGLIKEKPPSTPTPEPAAPTAPTPEPKK